MSNSSKPWLGGDTNGSWSNHYELLGIPVSFDDKESINRIANLLLQRLQNVPNDGSEIRQRIEAVEQARDCLTDTGIRAEYDQSLGFSRQTTARPFHLLDTTSSSQTRSSSTPSNEQTESNEVSSDIPTAIPIAEPIMESIVGAPTRPQFETRKAPQTNVRRQRSARSWFTIATLVLGGVLFAALAFLGKRLLVDKPPAIVADNAPSTQSVTPSSTETSQPARTPETVGESESPSPQTTGPRTSGVPPLRPSSIDSAGRNPNAGQTKVMNPNKMEPNPSQPLDPSLDTIVQSIEPLSQKDINLLSKALKSIPESLAAKRFARANKALSIAQEIATHPEHGRLVSASADLVHYTQEYWAAFDDAWNDLSSGSELVVGSTRVNVVEVTKERITLRVAGTNRRYQRDALPAGLQQTIVNRWLNPDAASTKLIVGAFWATRSIGDKNAETLAGDREKATGLWQNAKTLGAPADLLLSTLAPVNEVGDLRNLEAAKP